MSAYQEGAALGSAPTVEVVGGKDPSGNAIPLAADAAGALKTALPAAAALADAAANPTAPAVAAAALLFNGATWDRMRGDTASGLDVDPTGHTKKVRVVPTVSTSPAYATGDCVGGLLTFSNLARQSGGAGVIMGLTVADFANQKAELELWLFDQAFSAGTDNAAAAYSAADLANVVGVIPVYASDYRSVGTRAVATVRAAGLPFVCSGAAHLYGQLVTRGTPTYSAVTDIEVTLRALQD